LSYKEVIYKCENCGWELKVEEEGSVIRTIASPLTFWAQCETKTYICERCGCEIK